MKSDLKKKEKRKKERKTVERFDGVDNNRTVLVESISLMETIKLQTNICPPDFCCTAKT